MGDQFYCRNPLAFIGNFATCSGLLALEASRGRHSNENWNCPAAHKRWPTQRPGSARSSGAHSSLGYDTLVLCEDVLFSEEADYRLRLGHERVHCLKRTRRQPLIVRSEPDENIIVLYPLSSATCILRVETNLSVAQSSL